MTLTAQSVYMLGGALFVVCALVILALSENDAALDKRVARVGGDLKRDKKQLESVPQNSLRSTKDSTIPLLDFIAKALPNPNKLRNRLAATGKNITLGEYLLMNALSILIVDLGLNLAEIKDVVIIPASVMLGLGIPHAITGFLAARRVKKFIANFPEAIDTMCRGIRSGLPVTESIRSIGNEMPDPVGIEFRRISDGVRMGKPLEDAMWEVAQRVNAAELRFLIVAMAIQKETGGNLAETLTNLAEIIRRRRQLRLKVKAMSSEAKASAMIIGSLPFIMFVLLSVVNPDYIQVLFDEPKGKVMLGIGLGWMALGWSIMTKMTHFEL
ncbi:MAG: type II secretion system F family protein [Alphaproteobacteria bacterium]|nr:type II secretion system F family protein [Alphaproteobacteria bacterium]